ncbi:MAG: arsenite methyltransferase [Candidatus Limnocylindrales bacterium]
MATQTIQTTEASLHDQVREHYASAARSVLEGEGACCAPAESDRFGALLYDTDAAEVPEAARLASLGCGNPVAVAELRPGERVLDLGSGGGLDVLLSARRVGPTGHAFGLDMTDEMLELARRNAAEAGATNVEFLRGQIEAIPLPDASVDVVISNCVINLSVDKPSVLAEMARVLRPGGRIGISDVVAADELTPAQRAERGSFVGCVAGALSFAEYEQGLATAGFTDISVSPTHAATDGMYAAIVRATRGPGGRIVSPPRDRTALPTLALEVADGCCGDGGCC